MKTIFLDANIIVATFLLPDRLHFEASKASNIALLHYNVFICPITLAICLHKFPKLIKDTVKRQSAIDALFDFNYSLVDQTTITAVRKSNFHDLEDALQYFSAKSIGADTIITDDVHDFAPYSDIDIIHPTEFIQMHA